MGAPGRLALVERFVNAELATPEALGAWLAEHGLAGPDAEWSRGDLKRAVALRETLRGLLLRVEGDLSRDAAVRIARSLR